MGEDWRVATGFAPASAPGWTNSKTVQPQAEVKKQVSVEARGKLSTRKISSDKLFLACKPSRYKRRREISRDVACRLCLSRRVGEPQDS